MLCFLIKFYSVLDMFSQEKKGARESNLKTWGFNPVKIHVRQYNLVNS